MIDGPAITTSKRAFKCFILIDTVATGLKTEELINEAMNAGLKPFGGTSDYYEGGTAHNPIYVFVWHTPRPEKPKEEDMGDAKEKALKNEGEKVVTTPKTQEPSYILNKVLKGGLQK